MVKPFASLSLSAPLVMGIVNATPDSFSDGGDHASAAQAIAHGRRLIAEGADILDIGGESTRPGAEPVTIDEELRRVIPVIEGLAECGVPLSIDTRHALVMEKAIASGARLINDVTALTADPNSLAVAARSGAQIVLMHMRGQPMNMQDQPIYDDVVEDILAYLSRRIDECIAAGIDSDRLWIDPGIGFGKNVTHNIALLRHLDRFLTLHCPILLGVSRKSFIGLLSHKEGPKDRLPGSLAALLAAWGKAHIFRVHDVAATKQALAVWQAIMLDGYLQPA